MNDLISRQDFDKCLEDAEKESVKNRKYVLASALNTIRGNLRNFPSAQPEIIRCKDCKHRDVEDGFCEGRGWPMQLVPDDDFCSKAERRKNE